MNALKTYLRCMLVLSLVFFLFSPITSFAKIYHLTILHTNDHSGHFAKFSWNGIPDVGGMAARSTLVNIVRAEVEQAGGYVLLLSAGNVNIGVPESDLLDAEPDFKLMKMLGYDAMVLGNMDLCNPRDVLMQQREWVGCPFLSANLVKKETGERIVDPYIIKAFDGLHVAIFGLSWERTPTTSLYGKDLDGRSIIETAQALVPELRTEADLVIALTSIGFSEAVRTPGVVQVARAVPGIDVIVGAQGGDQTAIALEEPEVIGETLIVLAGQHGLYVGRLDLTIESETDTIIDYTYTLLPVNLKKEVTYHNTSYYMYVDQGYMEDPDVLTVVHHYLEQTEETLSQPVGEALVKLDGVWDLVTTQETNLANLITDAMRAKTGAEIAFQVAAAIGASIEPGPITYRDILKIHSFGNTLVLLDMTGEQIMDVLNDAATTVSGDFLHASGLMWTNNKGIPEDVLVGGTPIELDRMYKVVITSCMAGGTGAGGKIFKALPQFDTGLIHAKATAEYIRKAGQVAPKVEGRLTIIE